MNRTDLQTRLTNMKPGERITFVERYTYAAIGGGWYMNLGTSGDIQTADALANQHGAGENDTANEDSGPRKHILRVRLTERERDEITARAAAEGRTLSGYARHRLLS